MTLKVLSIFAASTVLLCSTAAAETNDAPNELNAVADFISENLSGKTFETRVTATLADGKLETEFLRRTMYLPVRRMNGALQIDRVASIKQKLWDLDEHGKRKAGDPQVNDRVIVSRTILRESKATGALKGHSETLASSSLDAEPPYSPTSCTVSLDGNKLTMVTKTPLYADGFGPGGTHIPISSDVVSVYQSEGGHVLAHETIRGYSVDPKTLDRIKEVNTTTSEEREIDTLFID